jgi:hypothetical protein
MNDALVSLALGGASGCIPRMPGRNGLALRARVDPQSRFVHCKVPLSVGNACSPKLVDRASINDPDRTKLSAARRLRSARGALTRLGGRDDPRSRGIAAQEVAGRGNSR